MLCGSKHSDHAEVVRTEQAANLLIARFLRGRKQARAGIVDKDVEPAKMLECLIDRLVRLRGVGNVEGERQHRATKAFCQVVNICQFAGGHRYAVAAFKSSLGPDAAEPA